MRSGAELSSKAAGANPQAFQFAVANRGLSNCFAGVFIGPHASCLIGIGIAPGAPAPSAASLVILSNDPARPETDIALTLNP